MRQLDEPAAIVLAAAEVVTIEDLARELPDRVARLVGAWGGLLYRYTSDGLEPLGGAIAASISEYNAELAREDPTQVRAHALAPKPRVVLATRAVGERAFQRSLAYTDYYRRHDIARVTCMWLNDRPYASPGMIGLLLARGPRSGEFENLDRGRLSEVLSALALAVRRCERVDSLRTQRDVLEGVATVIANQPYLVLDAEGTVIWRSSAASTLLAGLDLPDALRAGVRRLLAAAAGTGSAPPLELSMPHADGTLRAELQLSTSDRGHRVAIVRLERPTAPTSLARLRDQHGLTAAEVRILRLVALGLGNAAIAERCENSVETVRTHVARILAKLGVATRAQATVAVWSVERE